jgi:hypothetical protein
MTSTKQLHRIIAHMATAGLLGTLFAAAPTAMASQSTNPRLDELPTRIVVPTDPVLYPDPICLGCKIIAKRTRTSEDDDASGVLRVTYDEVPMFVGDIVLTVFLLDTEERRTVTLEGVVLTGGQTVELLVPADVDWTWDDVESVWVELVWVELVPAA